MRRLLVLIAILGLLAAGCGTSRSTGTTSTPTALSPAATPTTTMSGMGMPGMGGQSTMMAMSFDQMFIACMVPHHQSAIEMAKVAEQKAEHKQLRTLARNIISAQQKEIDQMRGWYKSWYGTDRMPTMGHGMSCDSMSGMNMGQMEQEQKQLATAKPFDRAFIDAMIPHHEGAVMMAKAAQKQAEHPEIKQLAQNIIKSQQHEIDEMQSWRKAWYGK